MIHARLFKTAAAIVFAAFVAAGCSTTTKTTGEAGTTGTEGAAAGAAAGQGVSSAPIEGQTVGGAQAPENQMQTVFYFDFDKSELRSDTKAALDKWADYLRNRSGIVRLEGHTDERGTREYNLALGERRAKAVANYLVIQGVPRSQIETISYGEEKPAVMGHNEAAWAKNRRVVLDYVE